MNELQTAAIAFDSFNRNQNHMVNAVIFTTRFKLTLAIFLSIAGLLARLPVSLCGLAHLPPNVWYRYKIVRNTSNMFNNMHKKCHAFECCTWPHCNNYVYSLFKLQIITVVALNGKSKIYYRYLCEVNCCCFFFVERVRVVCSNSFLFFTLCIRTMCYWNKRGQLVSLKKKNKAINRIGYNTSQQATTPTKHLWKK